MTQEPFLRVDNPVGRPVVVRHLALSFEDTLMSTAFQQNYFLRRTPIDFMTHVASTSKYGSLDDLSWPRTRDTERDSRASAARISRVDTLASWGTRGSLGHRSLAHANGANPLPSKAIAREGKERATRIELMDEDRRNYALPRGGASDTLVRPCFR